MSQEVPAEPLDRLGDVSEPNPGIDEHHAIGAEPVVGGRFSPASGRDPHLCGHPWWLRLCHLCNRCLLPDDRRLVRRSAPPIDSSKPVCVPRSEQPTNFDNAMAERINARHWAELVCWQRPWIGTEYLELAPLGWVDNTWIHSLHEYCTPVEVEAADYRDQNEPAQRSLAGQLTH